MDLEEGRERGSFIFLWVVFFLFSPPCTFRPFFFSPPTPSVLSVFLFLFFFSSAVNVVKE